MSWASFKTWNFEFLGSKFSQNVFLGKELKKQLSISELIPPNTSSYRFSFQTKHFEVSGPNLQNKFILGTEFEKAFVKFRISTPEYSFVSSFILKKTFSNFRDQTTQEMLLGRNLKKLFLNLKKLWIPRCTHFHFKQSILNFWDQVRPKRVF